MPKDFFDAFIWIENRRHFDATSKLVYVTFFQSTRLQYRLNTKDFKEAILEKYMDILQHTTSRNKQAKILGNLSLKEKASSSSYIPYNIF